ncbi:MAG: endonuclease/exonuclease/phosphatase family protein, partial [Proteobacteria bacterium]|nr:endonuclease/exonuclease/phosphatase family protein [Pseudomonadota bacterium]
MSLSVLTLNILHDYGPWKERAARIREWLDLLDPDLVGLQEVLRGPGSDQCEELFEGRGFHLDFVGASDFWKNPEQRFGNAVASRWPIREREELVLPDKGDGETRAALSVTVDAPVGPVCFTTTHLNWRFHHGAVRERQVVALCDWVRGRRPRDGFPPILVGDFNADPESSEIRYVKGLQSLEGRSVYFRDAWAEVEKGDGITWSNRNDLARLWLEPDRRIDYIFIGPPGTGGVGMIQSCRVVCDSPRGDIWPSDHFGVYT